MNFRLQLEKNFVKHYKRLTTIERGMVDGKLRILARDPWHRFRVVITECESVIFP